MRFLGISGCWNITGALDKLVLPAGMETLDASNCCAITCDIDNLVVPTGMKKLNLAINKSSGPSMKGSELNTGNIGALVIPEGMLHLDISGNTRLTGAIDQLVLPAGMDTLNATGCINVGCDIAQLQIPEGMSSIFLGTLGIQTGNAQVYGNLGALVLPEGMRSLNLYDCSGITGENVIIVWAWFISRCHWFYSSKSIRTFSFLTPSFPHSLSSSSFHQGDIDTLVLPESMKTLAVTSHTNPSNCRRITGDIARLRLPAGMERLTLSACVSIRGNINDLVLPQGIQHVRLNRCSSITGALDTLVLPDGLKSFELWQCKEITGTLPDIEKAKVTVYRPPIHQYRPPIFGQLPAMPATVPSGGLIVQAPLGGGGSGGGSGGSGSGGGSGSDSKG